MRGLHDQNFDDPSLGMEQLGPSSCRPFEQGPGPSAQAFATHVELRSRPSLGPAKDGRYLRRSGKKPIARGFSRLSQDCPLLSRMDVQRRSLAVWYGTGLIGDRVSLIAA